MDNSLDTHSSANLFKRTRKSFGESVFRAMQVSTDDAHGKPGKQTMQSLADHSGVGRSTIAKYIATHDDDSSTNPDLKTLCRLANSLNVPPALLLMRPEDWSRLAQAAIFMTTALNDTQVHVILESLAPRGARPVDISLTGLKLAHRFGVCSHPVASDASPTNSSALNHATDDLNSRIRRGILATTALPPLGQMSPKYTAPLLSLCATMGANTYN